jgi:elongation factor P
MYETSDIRKGLKIQIDGVPFTVVDFQFVKPGKGRPFTRTKIRNLLTGAVLERTFFTGEKFTPADIEEREMQFSYQDADSFHFMDTTTFEDIGIHVEALGEAKDYIIDGLICSIMFFNGRAVEVTPPKFVDMAIAETEPGVRGDTASNVTKPAILPTGATIQVPLFVNKGDVIRIDTRTAEYLERVRTP